MAVAFWSMVKTGSKNFEKTLVVVASRLRTLREQRGVSQEELADLVECHRTYIGMIERQQSNPSLKLLVAIADALKVEVNDLLK